MEVTGRGLQSHDRDVDVLAPPPEPEATPTPEATEVEEIAEDVTTDAVATTGIAIQDIPEGLAVTLALRGPTAIPVPICDFRPHSMDVGE